jgi:hypothetical protein
MRLNKKIIFLVFFCISAVAWGQNGGIGIIGELTHTKNAQRGETYETRIVLKNFGDDKAGIKVFQRDFSYDFEGNQFFHEIGTQARSNAHWIKYSPQQKTLLPQETTEVHCSIHVPNDQGLVGTFWSLIIIESTPVKRYAVQIITHIGLTGRVQVEFVKTALVREEKKTCLHVDVKNTGERGLCPSLYVELYDEGGDFVEKIEGGTWRIYPESSVRYQVDVAHLPAGLYKAMILVDNLDEHIFGTEFLLDLTTPGKFKIQD